MILTAMLALATNTAAGAPVDPAKAIERGMLRCGWPDPVRKTCLSIARFTLTPNDGFDVSVQGLPTGDGLVMSYTTRGRIEHGDICVTITSDDLKLSTYTKAGVTLSGKSLENIRDRIIGSYVTLLGRKLCDHDLPADATGVSPSLGFADGEAVSDLNRPVMWIDARAGYTLGPIPDELT